MDDAIGQFFRGRLVVSIIMGILLSAGWFVAGVPYWFVLGMLTGILNIVPYLSAVTWPVAIIIKYVDALTGGGETMDFVSIAVWPSAVYAAVQLLENWVLTPLIQSGSTNLSAFTVIVVVFVGASVGGVMGMLFAIPFAACIKILLDEVALPRLRRWAAQH
jgi:predicted PurR-regulated permease PerM